MCLCVWLVLGNVLRLVSLEGSRHCTGDGDFFFIVVELDAETTNQCLLTHKVNTESLSKIDCIQMKTYFLRENTFLSVYSTKFALQNIYEDREQVLFVQRNALHDRIHG